MELLLGRGKKFSKVENFHIKPEILSTAAWSAILAAFPDIEIEKIL